MLRVRLMAIVIYFIFAALRLLVCHHHYQYMTLRHYAIFALYHTRAITTTFFARYCYTGYRLLRF